MWLNYEFDKRSYFAHIKEHSNLPVTWIMKPKTKIIMFCFLLGLVGLIGLLHTLTPGHLILYHDSYRRLGYFPIVIGAILFGVWGGLALALASCLAYVPHLYLFFAKGPAAYYSELSEMMFYLAAGLIVGLISGRENRLREKYKALSEKLAESYQRLSEQASRLEEAVKRLGKSRKLSMLGQVSASLAHEIKNPLASIKGAAEILADEVGVDHPKHEFIEIMRSEVSRLNNSVEKVLAYCRGEQAKEKIRMAPIEKIIGNVILFLDSRFLEKEIRVGESGPPDLSSFSADEAALTQVLTNILINAVDAVGVRGRIELEWAFDNGGCRICISDDGPGIKEEDRKSVFHSFVTAKEGGNGLGLAISKRIVTSLGGRIHVEESEWGGARFCLFLPEANNLERAGL